MNYGLASRPNESFVGDPSCVVRSFDGEFGFLRRYHRCSTQGTAGKAECDTRRVPPEHLARPISQACTGIAWQPEASVLVLSRAPRTMLKNVVQRRTSRAPTRELPRKKIKIAHEIKKYILPIQQGAVTSL